MTDVSDGTICHVCLEVDTALVREAHDGKFHEALFKASCTQSPRDFAAEQRELLKVEAAQKTLLHVVDIGIKTLLSMQGLPELIAAGDELELRLLLCKVEPKSPILIKTESNISDTVNGQPQASASAA
jgi:hypothetical protein